MADTFNSSKTLILNESTFNINDINSIVVNQERLVSALNNSDSQQTILPLSNAIVETVNTISEAKTKLPLTLQDSIAPISTLSSEVFTFDSTNNIINADFSILSSDSNNLSQSKQIYTAMPVTTFSPLNINLEGSSLLTPVSQISSPNTSQQISNTANTISVFTTSHAQTLASTTTLVQNKFSTPSLSSTVANFSNLSTVQAAPQTKTSLITSNLIKTNKLPQVTPSIATNSTTKPPHSTIRTVTSNSSAPLGSSENPIQIIQQGNTFRSTQSLSQEQLQQIAQVLQQQRLSKTPQPKGGKAVLYNPSTNTRIIYRVIYPAQLQKKVEDNVIRGRGKGRPPRKRLEDSTTPTTYKADDHESRKDDYLSKEEKEAKKKARPRTRSGRVSKPPSYMIKDYKRIHHLDFDEEVYDDSDGGYSDYVQSDEENHQETNLGTNAVIKRKRFKCRSCDKAYIGQAGLARHYRFNPDHRDENEPDESFSVGEDNNDPQHNHLDDHQPPVKKARSIKQQEVNITRKKNQLKEALAHCGDQEVLEVVLPRLTQLLTPWELLVARSTTPAGVFSQLLNMVTHLRNMATTCLAMPTGTNEETLVDVSDPALAATLGISPSFYQLKPQSDYFHVPGTSTPPQVGEVANVDPPPQQTLDLGLTPTATSADLAELQELFDKPFVPDPTSLLANAKLEDIPADMQDDTAPPKDQTPSTDDSLSGSTALPLVLPNGQVIGLWCGGQVSVDPAYLASNMVILDGAGSTEDGGTTTESISLETLQALLSLDSEPSS